MHLSNLPEGEELRGTKTEAKEDEAMNLDHDTLEDISPPVRDQHATASSTSGADPQQSQSTQQQNVDSEIEVFDRIANKLLRSGLLLTALELHAELIERGKELPRLREFFDNPHNFEKQTVQNNDNNQSRQYSGAQDVATQPMNRNQPPRSPSEQTFDSLDFITRYSDDDLERQGDERIAVLEFELRKAQQTISSLRASLTMSTTTEQQFCDHQTSNTAESENTTTAASGATIVASSLTDSNSYSDRFSLRDDFYCRGSGDGDSCPGEDDANAVTGNAASNQRIQRPNLSAINEAIFDPPSAKYSLATSIKPHERRALNYLINEYLMANVYKLTAITFCDECADQDIDKWDDVGLNTDRPPDLLRLYRYFWQNSGSSLLLRSSSNATASTTKATTSGFDPFDD